MKHSYTLYLLSLGLLFSGCSLINPDEKQPAYIQIESIQVNTDVENEGSNASKISDAWIFIDDNLVGAYTLPCRIPVLEDGQHEVKIGAGIQINGISSLRSPYVFYRFNDTSAVLTGGQTTHLYPHVSYFDSLTFALNANFDNFAGNKLEETLSSDTIVSVTSNPSLAYEGNGAFRMQLRRDSGFVEFQTVDDLLLPKLGANVYAELNYKTSHEMSVGVAAYYPVSATQRSLIVHLNPSETWNKVYLNLTSAVSTQNNASYYKLFFYSFKEAGSKDLDLFIDNLKIVY